MSEQTTDAPDARGKILVGGVDYQLIRIGAIPPWMERLEHATETFIASDGAPAIRLVPGPVYRLPDRGQSK